MAESSSPKAAQAAHLLHGETFNICVKSQFVHQDAVHARDVNHRTHRRPDQVGYIAQFATCPKSKHCLGQTAEKIEFDGKVRRTCTLTPGADGVMARLTTQRPETVVQIGPKRGTVHRSSKILWWQSDIAALDLSRREQPLAERHRI